MIDLSKINSGFFAPYTNHEFILELPDLDPVALELIRIRDSGLTQHDDEKRSPFSLEFRAAPGFLMPQGIRKLVHQELGVLEIFLVPIGPDQQGMVYEAVFN